MNRTLTRVIDSQRAVLPIGINPLADRQVAVVGLGSLGSLLAESVVRLGFGRAVLVDRDIVDNSNLYRQTLYDTGVLGHPKAVAAEQRLRKLGSKTELTALVEHLSPRNVKRILGGCDLVLCAVDNTASRMTLNQYCLETGTPWCYGGAIGYRGEATLFSPPTGPCYACLFPDPVGIPLVDPRDCTREGILVPTVMAVASIMTFLALTDDATTIAGRRYTYNGATLRSASMSMPQNPRCPACADSVACVDGSAPLGCTVEFLCGNIAQVVPHADLHLDLRAIAQQHGATALDLTDWYLRFPWKVQQEVFLWKSGRLVVTNTQNKREVVDLYRSLTGGNGNP